MEAIEKPQLGYFDIRGQAQPIRYLLAYAGVAHNEEVYTQEQMGGALPAMPYFKDKSGKTEQGDTLKILRMVAQAYKPVLLE